MYMPAACAAAHAALLGHDVATPLLANLPGRVPLGTEDPDVPGEGPVVAAVRNDENPPTSWAAGGRRSRRGYNIDV